MVGSLVDDVWKSLLVRSGSQVSRPRRPLTESPPLSPFSFKADPLNLLQRKSESSTSFSKPKRKSPCDKRKLGEYFCEHKRKLSSHQRSSESLASKSKHHVITEEAPIKTQPYPDKAHLLRKALMNFNPVKSSLLKPLPIAVKRQVAEPSEYSRRKLEEKSFRALDQLGSIRNKKSSSFIVRDTLKHKKPHMKL